MIDLSQHLKHLKTLVVDNSPAILTAIGVTGTISTAVLAAQAGMKACYALEDRAQETRLAGFTRKEQVIDDIKFTWKFYIPPVAVGLTTIACILGANHISSKRSAALVTAYSLTEKAFTDYKEKVVEQIGANKEQKVRDSIAQDKLVENPVSSREVIITGNGKVLCYETYTARYFESDMETIRKAQNDLNQTIFSDMYISLNDLNRELGLPYCGIGEDVGWNTDKMLEIQFSTLLSDDGRPCISLGYKDLPFPNFHYMH